ncbi:MAG: BatA domain-containing protein [Planctomycetes bacterium]|nr:BatA domain-containing protein [Planctomycetota bacterium]
MRLGPFWFATPAFLAALALLPPAAAAYFLVRRRRSVVVAHLPLWEEAATRSPGFGRRARLFPVWLLAVNLLLVAALSLAAAAPFLGQPAEDPRFFIFLDTSPSMSAVEADGRTRLEAAAEIARQLADAAPPDADIRCASFSRGRVAPVERRAFAAARGLAALQDYTPPLAAGAVAFLLGAGEAGPPRFAALVSDGVAFRGHPPPAGVWRLAVGARSDNVGFTRFHALRRWTTGEAEVDAAARNFGPLPVEVTFSCPDAGVDERFALAPGAERPLRYTLPDTAPARLTFQLSPGGTLACDDLARCYIPPLVAVRERLILPEGQVARPALAALLGEALPATGLVAASAGPQSPASSLQPEFTVAVAAGNGASEADVAFLDPDAPPPPGALRVGAAGATAVVRRAEAWDRWLRGVDLGDLRIDGPHLVFTGPDDAPLAVTPYGPVVVAQPGASGRSLRFGFLPEASNVEALTAAFPMLLRNVLLERMERMHAAGAPAAATLGEPDAPADATAPGFFTGAGGGVTGVNALGAEWSDLAPATGWEAPEAALRAFRGAPGRAVPLRAWCLALAAVAVAVEAWLLHRLAAHRLPGK